MQPYTLALIAVLLTVVIGGETLVKLSAKNSVTSDCRQSVTLHCTVLTNCTEFSVIELYWINASGEKLCRHNNISNEDDNIQCHYTPNKELSMTISDLTEDYQGKYSCMLQSNMLHTSADTTLYVSECQRYVDKIRSYQPYSNQASSSQNKWTFLVLTALLLTL